MLLPTLGAFFPSITIRVVRMDSSISGRGRLPGRGLPNHFSFSVLHPKVMPIRKSLGVTIVGDQKSAVNTRLVFLKKHSPPGRSYSTLVKSKTRGGKRSPMALAFLDYEYAAFCLRTLSIASKLWVPRKDWKKRVWFPSPPYHSTFFALAGSLKGIHDTVSRLVK